MAEVEVSQEQSSLNEDIAASLKEHPVHPVIVGLIETSASDDVIRAAAHVIVDRTLDQILLKQYHSEYLKQSAGEFGFSGYVRFLPEE
jgi:hypothetical protein